MIKYFSKEEALRTSNINSKENILNTFLNYDAQAMIKCIHNRELRRSGPIYILQEIPNHQLSTVSRLYKTTFQLVVPKNRKQSYPNPEAHPHMGPHVWPDLQCEFQATPLPFSHTPSTGTNHFQSKSQLIYQACWFPMAVSNQVASLDQRLRQRTVLNKIIPMDRTTSLASTHN